MRCKLQHTGKTLRISSAFGRGSGTKRRNFISGILRGGSASFRVNADLPTDNDQRESIPAVTIESLLDKYDVKSPLIVKMDIEGAQAQVFSDNTGWVGRTHLIALELEDWLLPWSGSSRSFFNCLAKYPFDYMMGQESIFCFLDFEATHHLGKPLMSRQSPHN